MSTEQERLAQLVGGEEEILDGASLLADGLRQSIGNPNAKIMNQVSDEIKASGDVVVTARSGVPQVAELKNGQSVEKVLIELLTLRDSLIAAFEGCKINTKISDRISTAIRISERLITSVGGSIDEFVPLKHVSGLKAPDFHKNAKKVIQTTIQCYTLGEISDSKISDDGSRIDIILTGKEEDTYFRVEGSITAEEWTGSEAIDYIYTPGEGKLSVKVFEDGRWIDKSDTNKYDIVYSLTESDNESIFLESSEEDNENISKEKVIPEKSQNNISDDIGDPIT